MKQRLRNYISVVTALSLCLGLWFGTEQIVRAESKEATIQVIVEGKEKKITCNISNFEANEDGSSYKGTLQIPETREEGTSGRYVLKWYVDETSETPIAEGKTPTLELANLEKIQVTDTGVLIILYGEYGAIHTATYYKEENNTTDKQERYFYQDSLTAKEGDYNHPTSPSFGEVTWTKPGYKFTGWGTGNGSGYVENTNPDPDTLNKFQWDSFQRFFIALWEEIKEIGTAGSYNLESNKEYTLGNGSNWIVEGDSSTYTGGITFYVPESKEYKFTSQ